MSEVTSLLDALKKGDAQAMGRLFELVYDELRQIAAQQMAREKLGHTLQPTALVHEAYLRLVGQEEWPHWGGRAQFLSAAARAMRRILIDTARRKKRLKRGGGKGHEPLDPDRVAAPEATDELLALNEALDELARVRPTVAELVELRYFGGLTLREASEVLGVSRRTADSYWAYARAWLLAELARGDDEGS